MRTRHQSVATDRPAVTPLFLLPLAAWAAIHFFAAAVEHPMIRAEGLFLAPWVAAVMAALLGVAPRPRLEAPVAAVLAATVVWSVHALSTPAAAVTAILVIALAVACLRRLAAGSWELDLPALCAAAIGSQILLHPEHFLVGQPLGPLFVELLVLPLAGALAVAELQKATSHRGLLVALVAVVFSGGWSPLLVLWLAAAASAGRLLTSPTGLRRLPLLAWLLAAAVLGWYGPSQPALLLVMTAAVLLAAARHPRASRTLRLGTGLALATGAGWLVFEGVRNGWPGGLQEPALLGLLLPTLAWSALRRPRTVLPLLGATLVGLVALPAGMGLVPALAFLTFTLPRERPLAAAQGVWSASIAGVALLLAGYPWLRADPVREALALFGAGDLPTRAPIAIAAAVVLGAAASWWPNRATVLRAAPGVALASALLAVAVRLPPVGESLVTEPSLLGADQPAWRANSAPHGAVRTVIIDSYLTHAAKLRPGEPVGRVVLEEDGGEKQVWTLRAGEDTAEWAARRLDIASLPGFRAPPGWIAWIEPERRFFAQRYRSVLRTEQPVMATALSIERTAAAEDLELVVVEVEVRP